MSEEDFVFGKYNKVQLNRSIERFNLLPGVLPFNHTVITLLGTTAEKNAIKKAYDLALPYWLVSYKEIGMTAFGYRTEQNLGDINENYEAVPYEAALKNDRLIPEKKPTFKILSKIGRRTYKAVNLATGRFYFGKTNHEVKRDPFYYVAHIHRDWFVYTSHGEVPKYHRTHVLPFHAIHYLPDVDCRIFLRPLMDNLQDLIRSCVLLGRSSAFMLATETFEAIHDLHVHGIIHRDIRPCNFLVGRGKDYKSVYMINFAVCDIPGDQYFEKNSCNLCRTSLPSQIMHKSRHYDWRFVPRAYHAVDAYTAMSDIESWLYMMLYFFHRDFVPWYNCYSNCTDLDPDPVPEGGETEILNMKSRFFAGAYDDLYTTMIPFIRGMRAWIEFNYTKNQECVDYPYGIYLLTLLHKQLKIDGVYENLDWVGVDDNTPNKILNVHAKVEFHKQAAEAGAKTFEPTTTEATRNIVKFTNKLPSASGEEAKLVTYENGLNDDDAEAALNDKKPPTSATEGQTQENGETVNNDDPADGTPLPSFSNKKK